MGEKLRERIEILEREVKERFEQTGLVTNVKIKGNLCATENPLHLEYKIKDNARENKIGIRFFRTHLVKILLTNHYQISQIREGYCERGLQREIVIVNPEVQLNEEEEAKIRYDILQDIKKELVNYLERKHRKA